MKAAAWRARVSFVKPGQALRKGNCGDSRDGAVPLRACLPRDQPENRCKYGREGVAEQHDIEDVTAGLVIGQEWVLVEEKPEHDDGERESGDQLRGGAQLPLSVRAERDHVIVSNP